MLHHLRVRQLGVVEDQTLEFRPGMTAITGETGAGKTMIVEAIRLLTGGRGEPRMVRTDASEAIIEALFDGAEDDVVLSRTISKAGKGRVTVNDRMVTVAALAEQSEALVDLHAQHAHQALLAPSAQRGALDSYGKIDLKPLIAARRAVADVDNQLASLGGDPQARAREMDLLRFQLQELDDAALTDEDEDDRLADEVEVLSDAGAHREAAVNASEALNGENGVTDLLSLALKQVSGRAPLAELEQQLKSALAEVSDVASEAMAVAETLRDDPERLEVVQERRASLKQLMRKYGDSLAEVIDYRERTRQRLFELDRHEELVAELSESRAALAAKIPGEEAKVRKQRASAAAKLAEEIQVRLRELALPNARFEITVGHGGAGDDVEFLLGPNPGLPVLPVAKAASGGELARTMLAMRLSLTDAPTTQGRVLVFDEVDAGIGGEAAVAVGKALRSLAHATNNQVLVVTHLPQVAAFADNQVSVEKSIDNGSTAARLRVLADDEREVELARMLSGRPDSDSGRAHARELLDQATSKKPAKKKKPA